MQLSLPFDPPWLVKQAPNHQFAAILPGAPGGPPAAIVTFGPIIIKPDEPRRWLEQVVRFDLPPGMKVELGRMHDHKTDSDWPVRLVEATVLNAKGEIVEARLCAMYTFMEHGAVAIARTAGPAQLDSHRDTILDVLERGRPDWRGEPVCLAEAWDLEAPAKAGQRAARRAEPVKHTQAIEQALAGVDQALAARPTAIDHVRRGVLLLELGRPADAVTALTAALALDAKLEAAHYHHGVALGELGKHADAIAAWQQALAIAPDRPDTHYRVAHAKLLLKDHAAALASFQKVVALDPSDLLVQRKVIQCLHALGRFDDGQAARLAFRTAWQTSSDPRTQLITEYVFDEFEGDGFSVRAFETLRPHNPSIYPLFVFRAVQHHGDHEHSLPASVLIETSDQAKLAATPFVLAVTSGSQYRVVGAAPELPPYPQLRADVLRLIGEALREQPGGHATG